MKRILVSIVALLAFFAAAGLAADIDGQWKAQVLGHDGQTREFTFTFKADGDKLIGKASDPRGEYEINDGKIKGDTIAFVLSITPSMKVNCTGTVSGNELTIKTSLEGRETDRHEYTAKKVQ
jgi:hypothetical protein